MKQNIKKRLSVLASFFSNSLTINFRFEYIRFNLKFENNVLEWILIDVLVIKIVVPLRLTVVLYLHLQQQQKNHPLESTSRCTKFPLAMQGVRYRTRPQECHMQSCSVFL